MQQFISELFPAGSPPIVDVLQDFLRVIFIFFFYFEMQFNLLGRVDGHLAALVFSHGRSVEV